MMELGFNMAGTEKKFEEMLKQSVAEDFRYVEIGVAECTTLIAVADWANANTPSYWNCLGLDIPGGQYFSADKFISKSNHAVSVHSGPKSHYRFPLTDCGIDVCLMTASNFFSGGEDGLHVIHFCLIDGCHGKRCSMGDFWAIEPWMVPGGIVAFHDSMPEDQGVGFQAHCNEPINVRSALIALGLIENKRLGWELISEVLGDKSKSGNGMSFFRKL